MYKYHSFKSVPSQCLRSEMLRRRGKNNVSILSSSDLTWDVRWSTFVNYMEQSPLNADSRLATRILRCSMKKMYDEIHISKHKHHDTKSKKIYSHELQKSASHLSTCFRLPSVFTTDIPTKRNGHGLVLQYGLQCLAGH